MKTKKPWPEPKDFETFDQYDTAWHQHFQAVNPRWEESGMYTNAQFDDIPYSQWEKSGKPFQ